MLELVSELNPKLVGKGHQPVDQAEQSVDFGIGVSLVGQLDGEVNAVGAEVGRVVAVLLGAEVGSDDEKGLFAYSDEIGHPFRFVSDTDPTISDSSRSEATLGREQ